MFHVGGEDERECVTSFPAEGYGVIRTISGGRYTVGFFDDGSLIIANKDYENGSLCIVETDAALALFDVGTETFVSTSEKQFELPAGGGVYLRIVDTGTAE